MSADAARERRPRVSIGIPVFNGAPFLRETLDCIVGQTWRDSEIVISDNASTDETPEICRDYAAMDPRIRYHRAETNAGSAWNFNRVITLSTGTYFKLANADDLCDLTLVEKCVGVLDAHCEVVACFGRTTLIDEQGRRIRDYDDDLDVRDPDPGERFVTVLRRLGLVNMMQGVVRLDALITTGLMERYLGSDMVLVAELALHGQFHEIDERLFYRRMHGEAFSGLGSLEEKVAYMVPTQKGRAQFYYWRHYAGYLRAIRRSPLSPRQKLALLGRISRRAVGARTVLLQELHAELSAIFGRAALPK
jgi:glycosyltransferase involved in cell wall biosynthesis